MKERISKFFLCIALVPVLLGIAGVVIAIIISLPIVVLIKPDIIKVAK